MPRCWDQPGTSETTIQQSEGLIHERMRRSAEIASFKKPSMAVLRGRLVEKKHAKTKQMLDLDPKELMKMGHHQPEL